MKRIRFGIIDIPGRVVIKDKQLEVRLTRNHPALELLNQIRERICKLDRPAPG
jgi:hypothetical protein